MISMAREARCVFCFSFVVQFSLVGIWAAFGRCLVNGTTMQVAQVEQCLDNMALRIRVVSILAGFDGVSRATAHNLMSILTCS